MTGEWDWDRLVNLRERPGGLDRESLKQLEEITLSLSRLERSAPTPAQLLPAVDGHLRSLLALLRGGVPSWAGGSLQSLAAETTGLAGWLNWDLGRFDVAGRYFQAGMRLAWDAGDMALGAYLLGSLATQPLYRENAQRRLTMLEGQTFGLSVAHASPQTSAWLCMLEANAHAMLGEEATFYRCAELAEELLEEPPDEEQRRPRVAFFDAPYFAEEAAAGLLRLNQPEQARQVLLGAQDLARGRMRLWFLLDLAIVAAEQAEAEQAASYATEALEGAVAGQVEPVLVGLRKLDRDLSSYFGGVSEVREYSERLLWHTLSG